ncbi:MAG: 50S ribosomal protein L25/general stress protein Ctc [Gammaproteobacteria bacterium]|nr:50S ribosomal protein L25/general stress protein Ctc [Gammaproteobacteria bacterium]
MSIELNATVRDDMGKGASRRLRHANKLPAIVYGAGKDPVNLTLEQKDVQYVLPQEAFYSQILSLNMDGKKEDVLLRDLQHHPYKMDILHIDFQRVDAKVAVHVHVPLHFVGEDVAPGVKTEGGAVNHVVMEVEVECLPGAIPEFIEVDLSEMHLNDVVHLSDLKLPKGVEVLALKHGEDHDTAVAGIHVRKAAASIEEPVEAPAGEAAEGEGEGEAES